MLYIARKKQKRIMFLCFGKCYDECLSYVLKHKISVSEDIIYDIHFGILMFTLPGGMVRSKKSELIHIKFMIIQKRLVICILSIKCDFLFYFH